MRLPVSFAYPHYLWIFLVLPVMVGLWQRGRNRFRRLREGISLVVRLLILALLVLGLAGLQWVRASNDLAVVFLLDVSDSVDQAARAQAVEFVRAALSHMGSNDHAALVLFGSDALVERPMSQSHELGELLSVPSTFHTDIGQAIRLGLALLPATAQRRLVLLSDGVDTVSGATANSETAARLAAAGGAELDVVPLPGRGDGGGEEVLLDSLNAPSLLYEGEMFGVTVRVRSTAAQYALIRLYADDALAHEELVYLQVGLNSFLFEMQAGQSGFSTFTAQLVPEKDVFYQNNVLGAFALVRGQPRVLVVARSPYPDKQSGVLVDDAQALMAALESVNIPVERVTPAYMPADLPSLGEYAAVVLANVPATDLSPRQMELLQAYVRDLGHGLVCVGGEESYGVGGYVKTPLEETLPVEMVIKDRQRMPPLAIIFVVDKSGSMDMAASPGTPRKIELVKEAVVRSLDLLNPGDQVGVVAFEDSAQWVWNLAPLEDVEAVKTQVMTMRGGGGTDIFAGLEAAVRVMEGSDARLKHVILLTDGGASETGLRELALRLQATNGTLSTVGVGQDAATFLQQLALDGGGRYHYTDNPATIPQIFAQETSLAQRAYIVEELFYPALAGRSLILSGIETTPPLYGYVAASPKPAAQVILVSGQDDPLLAQWQYGLGRAVAWTSDAKGKWAQAWLSWEQFPRFWAQTVRWTIVERDESGLETRITDEGERARIAVDVVGDAAPYGNDLSMNAYLISPSLKSQQISLRQTAPGHYEAAFRPEEQGVYLVRIAAASSQPDAPALTQTIGMVRAYSPEYRLLQADENAMRRLAEAGQGRLLDDPAGVFQHTQQPVYTFTDIWMGLLIAAVCLTPLDVGVRRVTVRWSEMAQGLGRAWGGVMARLRHRPAPRLPAEQPISRLMEAKKRAPLESADEAAIRPALPTSAAIPPTPPPPVSVPAESVPAPVQPPAEPPAGDMAARLLAAKKRAGRTE